jgi:hypothetical protein
MSTRRSVLFSLAGLTLVSVPELALAEPEKAVAAAGKPDANGWQSLFDGQTLGHWKRTEYAGGGEVRVDKSFQGGPGALIVEAGEHLSGVNWTKDAPKTNFEITLEAIKVQGNDFMCGLTFPVGDSFATLIMGGWGGETTGISSINDSDASENPTSTQQQYLKGRWYRVRMRVTPDKLQAWLDDKQVVDADIRGKKVTLRRGAIDLSAPIGLSTYQTTAAYRNIKIRRLKG